MGVSFKRFFILLPSGDTYRSCDTFDKARAFAEQIKTWVLVLGFQDHETGGATITCREEDIEREVQAMYGDDVAEIVDYMEV